MKQLKKNKTELRFSFQSSLYYIQVKEIVLLIQNSKEKPGSPKINKWLISHLACDGIFKIYYYN